MAIDTVTIGGVVRQVQQPGLSIQETMNGCNALVCEVLSDDGAYRPARGDLVFAEEDGERVYGGLVDAPSEKSFGVAGGPVVLCHVAAVDFNAYASARFVVGVFPGGSTLAFLQWLLPFLSPLGVTIDPAQDAGPTLPMIPFPEPILAADALTQASTLADRPWNIDYWKQLSMLSQVGQAAPFDIDEALDDGFLEGELTVDPATLSDYADKVTVRFTGAGVRAYAFLAATVNFSAGETVTLGGQTYTFRAALGGPAGEIVIGASVADSLERLAAAIVLGAGAGVTYAATTTVHASAEAYMQAADVMKARALTVGVSGNNIAATTTAAHATWYTEGGGGTATLCLGADEALTERVTAGTGLWERDLPEPTVRDATVAQLMADAYLARLMAAPKIVRYQTDQVGLHPGQVQAITWPSRLLSGDFLITDVEIVNTEGDQVRRRVTAYGGTALPARWQDDAKQMFSGGGGAPTGGGLAVAAPSSGGASRPWYYLGASAIEWVRSSDPDWTPASAIQVQVDTAARGSLQATLYVRMRAADADISVTARLWDVTVGVAVATSEAKTSTDYVSVAIPVTLTAGAHVYELQVLPGTADKAVNAIGHLE